MEKGQVSYLEDLIFYPKGNEEGYLFEWKDNYDREVPKLKMKFPKIKWENVQNNTIEEGFNLQNGLILFNK